METLQSHIGHTRGHLNNLSLQTGGHSELAAPSWGKDPTLLQARSTTGMVLEWSLGHMDTTSVFRGHSSPSPWLSMAEAFEQVLQKRDNDSGTLIAPRALSALWRQRGEFSDAPQPPISVCNSWRSASGLGCRQASPSC